MGEARQRGTYEERKEQAIDRAEANATEARLIAIYSPKKPKPRPTVMGVGIEYLLRSIMERASAPRIF